MKKRNGFIAGLMMSAALLAAGVLYTACEQPDVDLNPLKEKLKEKDNPAPSPEGEAEEEPDDPNSIEVTSVSGLVPSLDWIKANGKTGNSYTIIVTKDETIAPYALSADSSVFPTLKNVTIMIKSASSTSVKRVQLSQQGAMFTVTGSVTLILKNIILDGLSTQTIEGCIPDTMDNNSALVVMNEGSSLQMKTGSKITGNTTVGSYGGGVFVSKNGTFTMSGGSISGNTASASDHYYNGTLDTVHDYYVGYGGGVCVSGGTFTMSGGSISGNTAADGTLDTVRDYAGFGGGVYVSGGTFTMSGGSISENTANSSRSIDGDGGGVIAGTFTMSGGSISGNTANNGGGVYAGTFTMSGGSISGNTANNGGGVYFYSNGGTFTMSGGSISGNTANNGGGGVIAGTFTMSGNAVISGNTANNGGGGVIAGTFTMSGNAVISGNTANNGGGVDAGTFTMSGNATISGNTANNGGGVNAGTFTMFGNAVISGNTANNGGGVNAGAFTMSGGSISGNTANNGGGVNFYSNGGTFTMSGGAISGNTANEGNGGGVYMWNSNNSFTYAGAFTMSGGAISGNAANNGSGGGVYIYINRSVMYNDSTALKAIFSKTGGTIYGSNGGAMKNTTGYGQAVYMYVNTRVITVIDDTQYQYSFSYESQTYVRNTTAGPGVNLSSTDLTTNWEQ